MIEQVPTEKSFEQKRAKYFSRFALEHLQQMRVLKEGKVLGKENEAWRNVSEHCLTEAVGADILGEHLGANRDLLVRGVLIHDWFKRQEIANRKEHGVSKGYELSSAEDEKQLRELGVSEELIHIAHANIPVSDSTEYLASRTLEEKIMHYLDMVTDQSTFMDIETRLSNTERNPATMAWLETFREKFHGKHLNELQREIGYAEQKEFETQLGLEDGTLLAFLASELLKRIENQ